MFLFIYAASGPLHYNLHSHRAFCNNAGLMESYCKHPCASEATRNVIKYQPCVKTNSCVFNFKPANKIRNPENL